MPLPSEPIKKDKRKNISPGDSFYKPPDVDLLDEKQWRYIKRRYRLSPRELEVAKLVCRGFVNGDVAKKLNVKPGTVKTHLRSVYHKTRVRNKVTMLLKFMHDADKLFNEPPDTLSVSIVDRKKPNPENASPRRETKKEQI